jgi:serine/threonine-protein kinase HipA
MMPEVSILDVFLYDQPIGTLTQIGPELTLFAFSEAYITDQERPVLGLRFKDSTGALITDIAPTRVRLPPFFSNLLPEGHMRSYLAGRAGVNEKREFFLIWVLGWDLAGAVTVRPAEGEAWPPNAGEDTDDGATDDDADLALHFSLAGVQLKFSAIDETKGGLTIPAQGVGGSWIVKLPSQTYDRVSENEYSMMTLARLIGMDVPPVQLVDVASIGNLPSGLEGLVGQALAVERFDRLTDGSTVHTEDFAQVFDVYPEEKYAKASMRSIARVIGAEGTTDDISELIRRLTFTMLIGNADMHLKNWSLIYPDRRRAALAPAYDLVPTIAYIPDEKAALSVSRTKRFDEFGYDELDHLAGKAGLPSHLVRQTAEETVVLFHEHWQAEKGNLPLTDDAIRAIDSHLKKVPIARDEN